jgi:hypothetical protein
MFCEDNSRNVALKQMKFRTVKHEGHNHKIYLNYFTKLFEFGDDTEFWVYVGTNAEPLRVEVCDFVQHHSIVNYVTLLLLKLLQLFCIWRNNGIILKPQLHFIELFFYQRCFEY